MKSDNFHGEKKNRSRKSNHLVLFLLKRKLTKLFYDLMRNFPFLREMGGKIGIVAEGNATTCYSILRVNVIIYTISWDYYRLLGPGGGGKKNFPKGGKFHFFFHHRQHDWLRKNWSILQIMYEDVVNQLTISLDLQTTFLHVFASIFLRFSLGREFNSDLNIKIKSRSTCLPLR